MPSTSSDNSAKCSCGICRFKSSCVISSENSENPHLATMNAVVRIKIERNSTIHVKSEPIKKIRIIRLGQFKKIEIDQNQISRVAGFLMPGDIIGLESLLDSDSPASKYVALEDAEICEVSVPMPDFSAAPDNPIRNQLLPHLFRALKYERSHVELLNIKSYDERFGRFLRTQGEAMRQRGYSATAFRLAMSRSDIASFILTTQESISRVIARYNNNGIAIINGRDVKLLLL